MPLAHDPREPVAHTGKHRGAAMYELFRPAALDPDHATITGAANRGPRACRRLDTLLLQPCCRSGMQKVKTFNEQDDYAKKALEEKI